MKKSYVLYFWSNFFGLLPCSLINRPGADVVTVFRKGKTLAAIFSAEFLLLDCRDIDRWSFEKVKGLQ